MMLSVAPTTDDLLNGLPGEYLSIWYGLNTPDSLPGWESGDGRIRRTSPTSAEVRDSSVDEDGIAGSSVAALSDLHFDSQQWLAGLFTDRESWWNGKLQKNDPPHRFQVAASKNLVMAIDVDGKGQSLLLRKSGLLTESDVVGDYGWFQMNLAADGTSAYAALGTLELAATHQRQWLGKTSRGATVTDIGTWAWNQADQSISISSDPNHPVKVGEGGLWIGTSTEFGYQRLTTVVKKGHGRTQAELAGDYLMQELAADGTPYAWGSVLHVDANGAYSVEPTFGDGPRQGLAGLSGTVTVADDGTLLATESGTGLRYEGVLSLDGQQFVFGQMGQHGGVGIIIGIRRPTPPVPAAVSVDNAVGTTLALETAAEQDLTGTALAGTLLNGIKQVQQALQQQGASPQAIAEAVNRKIEEIFGPLREQQLLDAGFDFHQHVVLWGSPAAGSSRPALPRWSRIRRRGSPWRSCQSAARIGSCTAETPAW